MRRNLGRILVAGGTLAAVATIAARNGGGSPAPHEGASREKPHDERGRREAVPDASGPAPPAGLGPLGAIPNGTRTAGALLDGGILMDTAQAAGREWLACLRMISRRQAADLERLSRCRSPADAMAIQARSFAEQTETAMRAGLAINALWVEAASGVTRGFAERAEAAGAERNPAADRERGGMPGEG